MTPVNLRVIGRLLYGIRWQTPMAQALGVHPRTIARWDRGDAAMRGCAIPKDLPRRLADLAQARQYAAREAERLARQSGGE
jgi:hypothetical protein